MNDCMCFETLDRTLRDILDHPHVFFDGISVMLGGDFCQNLPIKKGASKLEIISSSISQSSLWTNFRWCILKENRHLSEPGMNETERQKAAKFNSWLFNIGDDHEGEISEEVDTSWINIPNTYCIKDGENGIANQIEFIYDYETLTTPTAENLQRKTVVCPMKVTANIISTLVLAMLQTSIATYVSLDEATHTRNDGGETELLYPTEYLNSLHFPGFPMHQLDLQVGAPVMLLCNVNLAGGLCIGTCMIIKQLLTKVIEVQIITGTRIGEKVFIHRIPLTRKEPKLPFIVKQTHFPSNYVTR